MRWFRHALVTGRGRPPRRTRLGAVVSLGAMLSGLLVAVAPGAANAGAIVPCPSGITEWRQLSGQPPRGYSPAQAKPDGIAPWYNLWEGYRYTLVSAVPEFMVSDGQALANGTDIPAPYEISSSLSKTYKISATVGINAGKADQFLKANVSTSIEASVTTTIGVKFSVVVPPRTTFIAEYGTTVYQVSYYIEAWRWRGPAFTPAPPPAPGTAGCEEWGYYPQTTQAGTILQTWRLRVA